MPSIDPVSKKTKKKLNYLKASLTDEFDGEPTWDETIEWLMNSDRTATDVIREQLESLNEEDL